MTIEERAADLVAFFGVPKDYRGTVPELTAWLAELIREQVREAVAAERERCAQVADWWVGQDYYAERIADRIRSGE